ncbi:hypothetical protein C2G38_2237413 [Gigaspora rosea]|uniref:Uncharacterized protein n=1 Tax=Gigaspora rosea TaxID=44941 RepID=A0A397TPI5_9GLOM|nr:hypothetical protein C2G38_2237413 [Gigaspora rosea]
MSDPLGPEQSGNIKVIICVPYRDSFLYERERERGIERERRRERERERGEEEEKERKRKRKKEREKEKKREKEREREKERKRERERERERKREKRERNLTIGTLNFFGNINLIFYVPKEQKKFFKSFSLVGSLYLTWVRSLI